MSVQQTTVETEPQHRNDDIKKILTDRDAITAIRNILIRDTAHDLTDKVSTIQSMSEIMKILPTDADKAARYIDRINACSQDAQALISRFVEVAELDLPEYPLHCTDCRISDILSARIAEFTRQSESTPWTFNIEDPNAAWGHVDAHRLEQYFDLLLAMFAEAAPVNRTAQFYIGRLDTGLQIDMVWSGTLLAPDIATQCDALLKSLAQESASRTCDAILRIILINKIVRSHAGTIDLSETSSHTATVSCTLAIPPIGGGNQ